MSEVCFHHQAIPIKIYDNCVGCEIESLRQENENLKQHIKGYQALANDFDLLKKKHLKLKNSVLIKGE
jgi:hypothetical protein